MKKILSLLIFFLVTSFFCAGTYAQEMHFPGKYFYTYQKQKWTAEDAIRLLPKTKHKAYSEMLADLYSKMEADPADHNSQVGAYVVYNIMKKDLDDEQKMEWAFQLASVMSDRLLSAKLLYESGDPVRSYSVIEAGLKEEPENELLENAKVFLLKRLTK